MAENNNPSSLDFKVVDRRHFDANGEPRAQGDEPQNNATQVSSANVQEKKGVSENYVRESSSKQNETRLNDRSNLEVDFSSFVISMATQAVILMGEAPHPETGQRHENMEGARQTIEILAMLERKTAGNLTAQEESMLTDVLDNLRMTFVAKYKKK